MRLEVDDLRNLCKEGLLDEAVQVVGHTIKRGLHVSPPIFYILLQSCIKKAHPAYGKEVHRLIIRSGLQSNTFLASHLIRMFASCGGLLEANEIFNELPKPTVFTWSAIIAANANLGQGGQAIKLYYEMRQSHVTPDGHVFVAALKACARTANLKEGKLIEAHISESDYNSNIFVGNTLLDMFSKCGSLEDACRVFDRLPKEDVVTWNTMIAAHSQHGQHQEGFFLFEQMQNNGIKPDQATFVSILKACDSPEALTQGRLVHTCIIESGFGLDIFVSNTLIHMYATCGSLECAHSVFNSLPKGGVVTWNAMITGYIQHGRGLEALLLLQEMLQTRIEPNCVTYVCILKACSSSASLNQGKLIHDLITANSLESDLPIGNCLIDMYSKCGSLFDAIRVFEKLPRRGVVTWNAILSGFAQHSRCDMAFQFFQQMQQKGIQPDQASFVCILKACTSIADVGQGLGIHGLLIESGLEGDVLIGNSLVDMYAKCEKVEDARKVFDEMSKKDTVTWNVMIAGYTQHLQGQEALLLFQQMQLNGVDPDWITFLSTLKACCCPSFLDQGKLIHSNIIENGFETDAVIHGTLIHMYGKCGNLENASSLFLSLPNKDLVMWNAMIGGYAERSDYKLVQKVFRDMQSKGLQPDDATFVSLLCACSRAGLLEEGCHYFVSMQQDYAIVPTLDHYNCMVDLLGRAGFLNEAEDLLQTIPVIPNIVGWTSLLGHCKTYGNLEVGRRCFNNFVALDREDATGYVLMLDIYIHAGMEDDADIVEELRSYVKAHKLPGKALIEIQDEVNDFTVQEKSHPQILEIYAKFNTICARMKEKGYLPCVDLVLQSMPDDDGLLLWAV